MNITVPIHIENRRLFLAAGGTIQLEDWERQHLHNCEVCQGVFYVFINQPITPDPVPKKNPPAA
ncbi:MAG: hypothetical protein DMG11_09335 [Acidobacteria bacterium]|nr:MAG: hypothetical protein DMG11_09335 [Acidobacteriota bacterium]